jgi:intracellular sulfur oxidation DsrE/DsrF family protein
MFRGFLAGAGALFAFGRANAAAETEAGNPKVVYHLSDLDKVAFVLGNIRNHYQGTDGRVTIALVVHGPALAAFRAKSTSAGVASRFSGLLRDGLRPHACANTMRGMGITLADLVPGFASAEKGGVVKLAELQGQGYAYLRP